MKSLKLAGLIAALTAIWIASQDATLLHWISPALAQTSSENSQGLTLRDVGELWERFRRYNIHASIIGGFFGFLASWVAMRGYRKSSKEQLEQQRILEREKATMALVRDLGDESLPVRMGSATLLFDLIKQDGGRRDNPEKYHLAHKPGRMLQVLISVTKDSEADPDLGKLIGEELVRLVGALTEGPKPVSKMSPLRIYKNEKLDLQKVKFFDVLWPRVDARGIDFYKSDFTNASLRGAFLQGAIFYDACLKGSVFADADLQDADLRGADLSGVDFSGAKLERAKLKGVTVDDKTIWPKDFDPRPAL